MANIKEIREIFDRITKLDRNFYQNEYEAALNDFNDLLATGASPFENGKTVESIHESGERTFFATIQEAIDDAETNGGSVTIYEKDTPYDEALTLKNNVNIYLNGNASIETNSDNPSMLANGISCMISGEGSIRNIFTGTKREALRVVSGSNVIVKADLLSAIGESSSSIQGSTIYVNASTAEIYSRYISNTNNVAISFVNGASGKIKVLKEVYCENGPTVHIDTNSLVQIENTSLFNVCATSPFFNGNLVIASSAANLTLKDVKIENNGTRLTDYGINVIGTASGVLLSGVEISTITANSIYSLSAQTFLIRKPCWGAVDRTANITLSGFWTYTYG